jgi:Cof subfamily protein (haloacid dehalogenase superfamily)
MKKIKLVMVDVDSTLLNSKKECTQENKNEIIRITNKGVKFGIASGRTVFNILRVLPSWDLVSQVSYVIGSNGAEIFDVKNEKLYTNHQLAKETILEIYSKFSELGLDMSICVYEDAVLAAHKSFEPYEKRLVETGLERKIIDYPTYINKNYPKMIILAEPVNIDKILEYNKNNLSDNYRMFKSQTVIAEIVNPQLSKSFGVSKIQEILNLEKEEIMTIGDNDNDIEMVRDFVGIAMSNATENVKNVATYNTVSCEESGVAHILRKMV